MSQIPIGWLIEGVETTPKKQQDQQVKDEDDGFSQSQAQGYIERTPAIGLTSHHMVHPPGARNCEIIGAEIAGRDAKLEAELQAVFLVGLKNAGK